MFIPTGKYKFLEDGNAGLGMLVNELSGGSTVFFDKKKTFSFSALAAFEVHSKKKHTDIKTGDILSVEGGLGKTWYKKVKGSPIPMIFNAGAIYFFQQKLTSDKIPVGTTVFTGSKDHVWGIGAEGSMFIPKARINITARWLKDVGARNRTDGNTFFVMVAYMIKSFAKH